MHIFVYGSLLSGLWNNNLLSAGIPKLCRTKHKYTLYIENKVIPKLVREETCYISGELYDVPEEKILLLDSHEGNLYSREEIEVEDLCNHSYKAFTYLSTCKDGNKLSHGNYKEYLTNVKHAHPLPYANSLDHSFSTLIFVYGTLMSGMSNSSLIKGRKICDAVTVDEYSLYVSGSIPFLNNESKVLISS